MTKKVTVGNYFLLKLREFYEYLFFSLTPIIDTISFTWKIIHIFLIIMYVKNLVNACFKHILLNSPFVCFSLFDNFFLLLLNLLTEDVFKLTHLSFFNFPLKRILPRKHNLKASCLVLFGCAVTSKGIILKVKLVMEQEI